MNSETVNHLNEEAIALYADALIRGTRDSLPEFILGHVEDCQLCRKEILAVYDVMKPQQCKTLPETNDKKVIQRPEIFSVFRYAAVFAGLAGIAAVIIF
ncbi:MAG: hypothetical protein HC906_19435 [Bacteroidales bacterium]|nr:hypothetical protein [Bacteroidales bacterium]